MAATLTSKNQKERRERLAEAVEQGWSLNEIQRTLGVDYRTVRKHFPEYKPFPAGGGGMAATLRKANGIIERAEIK